MAADLPRVTNHELAVLRAVLTKGSIPAAAQSLGISPATVNRHLDRLRARFRVRTTLQLIGLVSYLGWLGEEPIGICAESDPQNAAEPRTAIRRAS